MVISGNFMQIDRLRLLDITLRQLRCMASHKLGVHKLGARAFSPALPAAPSGVTVWTRGSMNGSLSVRPVSPDLPLGIPQGAVWCSRIHRNRTEAIVMQECRAARLTFNVQRRCGRVRLLSTNEENRRKFWRLRSFAACRRFGLARRLPPHPSPTAPRPRPAPCRARAARGGATWWCLRCAPHAGSRRSV